jgi:hypothetical protein
VVYTLKRAWFIPSTVPPEIEPQDPDAVGSVISTDKAPRAGLKGETALPSGCSRQSGSSAGLWP